MARRTKHKILWPDFVPPHCPREDCAAHIPGRGPEFVYRKAGTYAVKCRPERIQRFLCRICRKTFSTQAFATDYYLKRPELLVPVAELIPLAPADRQIAHAVHCAPSTPSRLMPRIGQHLALFHAVTTRDLTIDEPVVTDDLETFNVSQTTQHAINLPVGQTSWFIYGLDDAIHFCGGRLTARRRREKERLIRDGAAPARGERGRAFRRLLDRLLARTKGTLHLVSDAHPVYASVIARHPERDRIRYEVHPNPKSRRKDRPRTPEEIARDQALFASDQLHRLARHSQAHDRRETIAFARSRCMALYRHVALLVWRNYVKRVSERKPWKGTAAMRVGLATRPIGWDEIFRRRIFPRHVPAALLTEAAMACRLGTRGRIPSARHRPARAH